MLHGYCIRWIEDPGPGRDVRGVGAAPITVVGSGGLAIWVSDAEPARPTPERLREHDHVVRHALESATPLPLRFGSRFDSADAVRRLLRDRSGEFEAALERVRDRVEVGLRILLIGAEPESRRESVELDAVPGESSSREDALRRGPSASRDGRPSVDEASSVGGPSRRPGYASAESGTAYLEERRRLYGIDRERFAQAETLLAEIESKFTELRLPTVRSVVARGDVVGTVAHLVHREQLQRYREIIEDVGRSRRDVRAVASGPWGPYSFV